jgi:hypothetical protein
MERILSCARHWHDARFDSIICHRGSHDHAEWLRASFMPSPGATAKDSCFFVKLRRISVPPGTTGTKYLVFK